MTFLSPNVIISSPSQATCSTVIPPLSFLSLDKPCTPDNGSNQPMIGSDYVVLNKIGQGSFAQVYVARHVSDASPKYAVKILEKPLQTTISENSENSTDEKFVANPDTEVACLKRGQGHPNIVRLHCVSSSANHVYLVQDYMQGGDMFDEIVRVWRQRGGSAKHGGIEEHIAVNYFLDLLSAVEYLHTRGIAHRDIKTENIFLSHDKSRIQLGDFGFATCSTTSYSRCGTLDYIAPEVLTASKETGGFDPKKADIWSCAVVLYAMLTARLPFDANSKLEITRRIKGRKMLLVPETVMSAEASDFLLSVFMSEPENRPTISELRNHPFIQRHMRRSRLHAAADLSPPSSR